MKIYSPLITGSISVNNVNVTNVTNVAGFATTSSVNTLIARTGSYATTGSNQFNGNQSITGSLLVNGGALAVQDGTILYHSIRWFTPTSTVSTSGTTVTSVGTQFTSGMVGAKLTVSGESRLITTYTSTTQVTVDSAYSQNYSGITSGSWGVYSRFIVTSFTSTPSQPYNISAVLGFNGQTAFLIDGSTFSIDSLRGSSNNVNYNTNQAIFGGNRQIVWTNSISNVNEVGGTNDLGLRRNTTGSLEIYNGVTADGAIANRRDLLLRNITGSNATFSGSVTVNGTLTAQTLVVQTITSSVDFVTGSSVNGSLSSNTHQFTGSVLMSGSLTVANLSTIEKTSAIYGVNVATTSGNGGNLTIKAGGGYGAGNTAGNLYLGFGRGNSSALNGSMYFGVAQATDSVGLDATYMAISSSGNVSIGTTVSKAALQVTSYVTGVPSIPSLGSTNGYVTTYFTNPNSLYGLLGGSLNSGNYWMQVQRTDGTAEAYNLLLQPNGGNVGIGKTPGSKLDIDGTITANKFTSAESVVAIPNSATTIFDATSQSGVWLVTAVVQGNGIQAGYAIVGLRSESTLYLLASGAGGQMTFSVSGATLRLSQSAGGTINTSISVMKINQGG